MPPSKPKADTWGAGCLRIVAYAFLLLAAVALWAYVTDQPALISWGFVAGLFALLGGALLAASASLRSAQERRENPPP